MEMKWVTLLEQVELLEDKKASSLVCQLEWKKLSSGMTNNKFFCQLLSGYEDFKEV